MNTNQSLQRRNFESIDILNLHINTQEIEEVNNDSDLFFCYRKIKLIKNT